MRTETRAVLPASRPATERSRWVVVLVAILVAVGFRWLVTTGAGLTPQDLDRFETTSGIDLPDVYAEMPFFLLWTRGDGQAFATLAADPLVQGPAKGLKVTDIRVTRMGYSVLGRLLAGGTIAMIPVGLLLANVLAVGLYAWSAAGLAGQHGRRAWWLLANPPLLIGFASDTAEPLGLALALAAIVAVSRMGSGLSALALGTVRPEMVATVGVGRHPLVALIAGGAATLAMQAYALSRVETGIRSGMNISFPTTGYFEALPDLTTTGSVLALAVLAWSLVTIVIGIIRRRGWARLSWIAYGLLIASLSPNVIHSGVNVVRVSGGLLLLWLASHFPSAVAFESATARRDSN